MRSWYDILEMSLERRADIDDIYQSAANHANIYGSRHIAPIVAVESGKAAFDTLKSTDYNIEWHDYVMVHISVFMNAISR